MFSKSNFIITNHARERFVERSNKKFKISEKLFRNNPSKYQEIKQKIKKEIQQNSSQINKEIIERLKKSKNEKSYKNCTGFMDWYYKKYGYKEPNFLVDKDIVFIVIHERRKNLVVTCLNSKTHLAGKAAQRAKFNKVKKKSEKIEELLLGLIEDK